MSAQAVAARPGAALVALAATTWLACFSDAGLHAVTDPDSSTGSSTGSTGTTDATTSSSTTTGVGTDTTAAPTTTSASSGAENVCGDGVVDPRTEACDDGNADNTDACLVGCVPAACGDGVVWAGVEECDDGAANHPTLPDACRPTCLMPACDDGGLYAGPLGSPIVVNEGPDDPLVSDDAPRTLGVAADGSFVVAWLADSFLSDRIVTRRIAADGSLPGGPTQISPEFTPSRRDLVLAVGPTGDYAIACEDTGNPARVWVRGVQADMPGGDFPASATSGIQNAPSIGLGASGELVVAYLLGGNIPQVHLRRFPSFVVNAAPDNQAISAHQAGTPSSPTVAMHPDGTFVVAWGDPGGAILYRRFTADALPGPIIDSGLRTGGGLPTTAKAWSAAAFRPSDGHLVVVGVDALGHLGLARFDQADALQGTVQVAETDARFVPAVDVASDAWGNLAVAWSACGVAGDLGDNCFAFPATTSIRWFYSDLTPLAPSAVVTMHNQGPPSPLSLAVAPKGVTAVSYIDGQSVLVRMSFPQCS